MAWGLHRRSSPRHATAVAMIDWVQWPAMAATLAAAWLVASQRRRRRLAGFAIFVLSNVLWVVWALPAEAYALVVLQVGLFALNVRGIRNNEPAEAAVRVAAPAEDRLG